MTQNLATEWGRRLRELREERGLSLGEVARKAGTDKAWYSRIERGEVGARGPGDDMKMAIAAALGVQVSDIWSYPEVKAS